MARDGHLGTWVAVFGEGRGRGGGLLLSSWRCASAPKHAGRSHRNFLDLFCDLGKSKNCLSSKKPWRILMVLAQRMGQEAPRMMSRRERKATAPPLRAHVFELKNRPKKTLVGQYAGRWGKKALHIK